MYTSWQPLIHVLTLTDKYGMDRVRKQLVSVLERGQLLTLTQWDALELYVEAQDPSYPRWFLR